MLQRAYLQLIRLPGLFTVMANIIAAHAIGSGNNMQWNILILSVLASAGLYHSGMVFNDWFDYDEDCTARPDRPLPSSRILPSQARLLAIALMSAGLLVAAAIGIRHLIIALVLATCILLYDAVAKKSAAGPWAMAACRYTNWLFGLAVVPLTVALSLIAVPVFLYTLGLTILSRQETLASDQRPLWLAAACLTGSAGILLYNTHGMNNFILIASLTGAFFILLLQKLWNLKQHFNTASIQRMVSALILGMIPLDALIVASQGHLITALAILTLLIPGRLLAQRIYIT